MWVLTAAAFLAHILACSAFPGHIEYQGCFSKLDLHRRSGRMIHPFDADKCFKLCSGNGHHYTGLDSMNSICYCGKDILGQISKVESSLCKPCKDNTTLYCGGVLKISVYEIESNVITDTIGKDQDSNKVTENKFDEEPYILIAGKENISLYNSNTHELQTLVKHEHKIDAIDYHLGRQEGFFISYYGLWRFPLFKKDAEEEDDVKFVAHLTRCPTFAVDWVHGTIYWPNCYSHIITFINFNDTGDNYNEELLVKPPEGAWAYAMAVDPYKGLLFWSSGATLWSCRLDGRGLTKVIPSFGVNRVSSMSLDLATERIYFTGLDKHDKNTSKVYYTSYSGTISHPLQFQDYEEGSRILSFGILNHHIYFVKTIDGNSTMLMASKLEYNHMPTIILQDEDIQVIKVVHGSLQGPGKIDECTYHNCSHMCIVETSLPRCYCPHYFQLENDNKTCVLSPGEAEEEPLVVRAALGLMKVLIVLLVAGVLMCLCDKLWSQLHPNVVRINVQRTLRHGRPDGENLI
ncbi:low-density lipoprotein receptor-related protein 1-like [Macrosteles quadrilineatus]|uniref:low-density lipoprotein receptor-related protein 1-like n=1 Tax=Macrosteles quadrilineatus TaxID=74068 RepID=UPI0023E28124|nr:low-density lipoprotein receptor-related protein 1-like [Macrosteles quadrilineatus]